MTTFDERERAYEAKLAHDEELRFRARARSYRQLGLWAAAKLGKTGAEAEAYAGGLVSADVNEATHGQILKTIRADFNRAGLSIPDTEIHRERDKLLVAAVEELTKAPGRTKS
ncbi:MAG: DUF1476 domain-containing protein [Alphaproteobacteria bacterium]|nr:DUF1476 domain-containing protein [Alphaproteobacteria bacterium]